MSIFVHVLVGSSFGLIGYLSGSLPFAIWITKIFKGVDVRDGGSGHASTTNTLRQAGLLPGVIVLLLDISKGFIPTWIALQLTTDTWIAALTACMAVAGHCWPLFSEFRGGMGLATTGGCLLAVEPITFVLGLGILIILTLLLKHSARAAVITGLIIAPFFWLFGYQGLVLWSAGACGLVISYRFLIDWNRTYRELWLDREKV